MPSSKPAMQHSLPEAWLPTQAFLQPSGVHDGAEIEGLDLSKMDENPLIYFLTPTPSPYVDGEDMEFDMDFDAGIEDAKHPAPIVRSVSPSSLEGLSRPPLRPPTPPKSPATPDLEFDLSATPDDHERYDYMDPSWAPSRADAFNLPRRLKDKFRSHARQPEPSSAASLMPPALPHSPRGRAVTRSGAKTNVVSAGHDGARTRRPRGAPARLSPHVWREPSPDVWAIEEQPEEELNSEMGASSVMEENTGATKAVDIPAAKPKKKVRFVLPAEQVDWGKY